MMKLIQIKPLIILAVQFPFKFSLSKKFDYLTTYTSLTKNGRTHRISNNLGMFSFLRFILTNYSSHEIDNNEDKKKWNWKFDIHNK